MALVFEIIVRNGNKEGNNKSKVEKTSMKAMDVKRPMSLYVLKRIRNIFIKDIIIKEVTVEDFTVHVDSISRRNYLMVITT